MRHLHENLKSGGEYGRRNVVRSARPGHDFKLPILTPRLRSPRGVEYTYRAYAGGGDGRPSEFRTGLSSQEGGKEVSQENRRKSGAFARPLSLVLMGS